MAKQVDNLLSTPANIIDRLNSANRADMSDTGFVEELYALDRLIPCPEGWIKTRFRIDIPDRFLGSRVVIYGAGNVGRDYYAQLSLYHDITICAWIDSDYVKYHYPYCEVQSPDALDHIEYDCIIVAVRKEAVADAIRSELVLRGTDPSVIHWSSPVSIEENAKIQEVGINSVWMRGGLGNQMFQYALYRSLQEHGNRSLLYLDDFSEYFRAYELSSVFPGVKIESDTNGVYTSYKESFTRHSLYREECHGKYDPNVFQEKDVSFRGYWQSEKYFADITDRIKREFIFEINDPQLQSVSEMIRSCINTVSIHIRRGDYIGQEPFICLPVEYYRESIRYMKGHIENPSFVFFSDDISWVKDHYREFFGDDPAVDSSRIRFIEADEFNDYHDWYDMYLMTCCDHNIIANSSFSWWGAWLNPDPDRIVIAPKVWLTDMDTPDICPEGWIRL